MTSFLALDDAGVIYDDGEADQGELIQAALDSAERARGAVFLGGRVRSDRSLRTSVPIIGCGSGEQWNTSPASILFPRDVPGYLIEHTSHDFPYKLKGFTIAGPGYGQPAPPGGLPAQATGALLPTRGIVEDFRVHGCRAAVASFNDHQVYRDFDFRGNGYGIEFIDNPDGGLGDMLFDHGALNDQSRAGIGLSDSATLANATFMGNGHIGMSPFGIHRYRGSAPPRPTALVGVTFQRWSMEICGNAVFYDEPGDGWWTGVVFDGPAESGTFAGPRWAGYDDLAIFDVGYASCWEWRSGGMPTHAGAPTLRARGSAASGLVISGVRADVFNSSAITDYGWVPFEVTTPYREWGYEVDDVALGTPGRHSGGTSATARRAHENISRGDLLEMAGTGHVARYRGGIPVGVAAADYAQGAVCVVLVRFDAWNLGVRNPGPDPIPQGALIMPDPGHVGGVTKATTREKAIGRVNDAPIPARGFGRAQIAL